MKRSYQTYPSQNDTQRQIYYYNLLFSKRIIIKFKILEHRNKKKINQ